MLQFIEALNNIYFFLISRRFHQCCKNFQIKQFNDKSISINLASFHEASETPKEVIKQALEHKSPKSELSSQKQLNTKPKVSPEFNLWLVLKISKNITSCA